MSYIYCMFVDWKCNLTSNYVFYLQLFEMYTSFIYRSDNTPCSSLGLTEICQRFGEFLRLHHQYSEKYPRVHTQDGSFGESYLTTLMMEILSLSASSGQWDISTSTYARRLLCGLSHYPGDGETFFFCIISTVGYIHEYKNKTGVVRSFISLPWWCGRSQF
jgi:hypothetical protein